MRRTNHLASFVTKNDTAAYLNDIEIGAFGILACFLLCIQGNVLK